MHQESDKASNLIIDETVPSGTLLVSLDDGLYEIRSKSLVVVQAVVLSVCARVQYPALEIPDRSDRRDPPRD